VARGYLNRPELTAERFVHDPYSGDGLARMYRTGDLGRWRPDGNIEFLGRNDFQVKIRGFRIELGEIEARLMECAGVSEAVVLAREEGGDKRLVAYYVAADETVDALRLREYVGAHLPEYMVPAAYVRMERLPLTRNGKLDRQALPAPESDAYVARDYEAPQGETEVILARIWSELLGHERVGRHDNFFELGGHSLLAMTMLERMRQAGLRADVSAIFTAPTVLGLAGVVADAVEPVAVPPNLIPAQCQTIMPQMLPLVELTAAEIEQVVGRVQGGAANVQDIYPLAPLQEGILFHHLLTTDGDPYLLFTLMSFDDRSRLD
jgi:aryl carrier-like protein